MTMNPPAPEPKRAVKMATTVKKTAVRYSDVIILLIGIAVGRLLGA